MTTQAEAREALYLAFETAWLTTGYTYTFDNETFDEPDTDPWARFAVRHFTAPQDSLGAPGNRRFLRTGAAFTQIFVPTAQGSISTGVAPVDTLSQVVREAFEGVSLLNRTIWFPEVSVREVGPNGKWYQTVVEAAFRYEEIR